MCISLWMCVGVYKSVHVRTCRWRSEVDIRGPSLTEHELTDRLAGQLRSGSCQGYRHLPAIPQVLGPQVTLLTEHRTLWFYV